MLYRLPVISCIWAVLAALTLTFPQDVAAREVSITLLHTSDLHGFVFPVTDYDGNKEVGGILRLASAIESEREGLHNVLLLDSGDTYQGGAESLLTRGRIVNEALGWLGFDSWVLGNHEFDWGLEWLAGLLETCPVPALGANISSRPGTENPLHTVKPFIIRDMDGVRVAVIGLTTPAIPTWSRPHLLGNLLFSKSVETLRKVMPAVREHQPDIMVMITHQGYGRFGDNYANEINAIAGHFPELDVILGGHTHQVVHGADVNGVLYVQPGYHGIWLGRVDLVYDTVRRELVKRESKIIHVGDNYEKHEGLLSALEDDLERVDRILEGKVGYAKADISAKSSLPGQSPMQQLICRAISYASEAEIVLHGILSDGNLYEGEILERDIWRIVPYENTIGVMMLTPDELRDILEENAGQLRGYRGMGVYGIKYDLYPDASEGMRVGNMLLPDGSTMHPRRRYAVAMNSYVLASGGGRFPVTRRTADQPISRLRMLDIDTRDAVRNYIANNSPVIPESYNMVTIVR